MASISNFSVSISKYNSKTRSAKVNILPILLNTLLKKKKKKKDISFTNSQNSII